MESTALTLPARAAIALQSTAAEAHLRELLAGTVGITSVTNRAGREECHKAAMAITKARTAIVSAGKTARDDANAFSKAVIAEERRLIGIVEAEETRLKGLRDAWDAEQARIREEAEQKEKARIDGILAAFRLCATTLPRLRHISERAKGLFSELAGFSIGDSFGEYKEKALGVLQDARAAVASIVDAKIAAEEEAARIKAEAEAARLAAEAAAAAHAAELAELRKQQEAAEEQRRIEAAAAKAEQERIQAERDRIAAEELRIEREAAAKARAELAAKEAEIAEQQRAIQAEKDAKEAAERAERERVEAEQQAKQTEESRRIAERLDLISDRCSGMEYWQLDEVIIAIDELLAKWAAA
jgi:hypothetical protein